MRQQCGTRVRPTGPLCLCSAYCFSSRRLPDILYSCSWQATLWVDCNCHCRGRVDPRFVAEFCGSLYGCDPGSRTFLWRCWALVNSIPQGILNRIKRRTGASSQIHTPKNVSFSTMHRCWFPPASFSLSTSWYSYLYVAISTPVVASGVFIGRFGGERLGRISRERRALSLLGQNRDTCPQHNSELWP